MTSKASLQTIGQAFTHVLATTPERDFDSTIVLAERLVAALSARGLRVTGDNETVEVRELPGAHDEDCILDCACEQCTGVTT